MLGVRGRGLVVLAFCFFLLGGGGGVKGFGGRKKGFGVVGSGVWVYRGLIGFKFGLFLGSRCVGLRV